MIGEHTPVGYDGERRLDCEACGKHHDYEVAHLLSPAEFEAEYGIPRPATTVTFSAYKIGGGPKAAPHWAHRWHVDRWFRSWQCEWTTEWATVACACMTAPRAWTKAGVTRKAKRWYRKATDVARHRARYGNA